MACAATQAHPISHPVDDQLGGDVDGDHRHEQGE